VPKLDKGRKGWFNESERHSLAARGIPTTEKPSAIGRTQFRPLTADERKEIIQKTVHREMFKDSPFHKKSKRKLINRLKRESVWDRKLQEELDYSIIEKYGIHPFGKYKIYRHRSGELYIIDVGKDISLITQDQQETLNFMLKSIEWWTEGNPTILIRRK